MKKAFLLLFLSVPCFGLETGWKAATGTDGLGGWTTPENAYVLDGIYAYMAGQANERWNTFNLNVQENVIIDGITVRGTGSCVGSIGVNTTVFLSWNAGASSSTVKNQAILTGSDAQYIFGSSTDTWDHQWRTSELSNTNFRIGARGPQFFFCNGQIDIWEVNVEYEYPASKFYDSTLYGGVFY